MLMQTQHMLRVTQKALIQLAKTVDYMNQKILSLTVLFGKEYYWMQDTDGTIYLMRVGEDSLPVFG